MCGDGESGSGSGGVGLGAGSGAGVGVYNLASPTRTQCLGRGRISFTNVILFFPGDGEGVSVRRTGRVVTTLSTSVGEITIMISPSVRRIERVRTTNFGCVRVRKRVPRARTRTTVTVPVLGTFGISSVNDCRGCRGSSHVTNCIFSTVRPNDKGAFS